MEGLSASRPLYLASGSPRRREILENLGVPFLVGSAPVDEGVLPGESATAYLERVVRAKLEAAISVVDPRAVAALVADTSVIVDGDIVGKPADLGEAEAMIARLAGRTHEVHTRFALGARQANPTPSTAGWTELHAETVVTRVTFRALTSARIRAYAASGEGLDKAGAYAVQGRGASLVARIEGSYTNVVGLPACEVAVALEGLGLLP